MIKLILKMIGIEKLILVVWDILETELKKLALKTKTEADDKLIELTDKFVEAMAIAVGNSKRS